MTNQSSEPISYSIKGAMEASGLNRNKIFEALRNGDVEGFKHGRNTLISGSSLRAFIQALPNWTSKSDQNND